MNVPQKLAGLLAGASLLAGGLGWGVSHIGAADTDRLRNAISSVCVLPASATATTGDFCAPEVETVALASAAHATTATVASADFTADGYRGVRCILNLTANATPNTYTLAIQGKDAISGSYYTVASNGATNNGTTAYFLALGPGVATTSNVSVGAVLPPTWRVTVVTATGSTTATYGVACGRTP